MKLPQYLFTGRAEADVDGIVEYTMRSWGEAQAQLYLDGLYHVLDLLSEKPEMGRRRLAFAPHLHAFVYRQHVIFYVRLPGGISIIRVLSAREDQDESKFSP